MLDPITCEGCGRKTYAQMAHCPQCGRPITVPYTKLNLPPKYIYEDATGVWVYPDKIARIMLNFLMLLGGGLFSAIGYVFLWPGISHDPRGFIAGPLALVIGALLIFQAIQLTFKLLSGLPIFYMGDQGIAFPHLHSKLLPWNNIKDARVIEVTNRYSKRRLPEIELNSPEKIVLSPFSRLFVWHPQQKIVVQLFSGWPITAEDIRDLILLGLETWTKEGRKTSSLPTRQEGDFDRTIRQALGFAALLLLVLFILIVVVFIMA